MFFFFPSGYIYVTKGNASQGFHQLYYQEPGTGNQEPGTETRNREPGTHLTLIRQTISYQVTFPVTYQKVPFPDFARAKHIELCLWLIGYTCPIIFPWISAPRPLCYKMKCITRVSSNLLIHQLIVGKYGTRTICSPRIICEIMSCFYHLFAEKSSSYLQLLDYINQRKIINQ